MKFEAARTQKKYIYDSIAKSNPLILLTIDPGSISNLIFPFKCIILKKLDYLEE